MTTVLGCPKAAKVMRLPEPGRLISPAPMKATDYKTNCRTRRETFPDGSQLVRRAGGGYEIIEARPKYVIGSPKAPALRKARRRATPPKPAPQAARDPRWAAT